MSKLIIKKDFEIEKIKSACAVASGTLDYVSSFIEPGISTEYIDIKCHEYIIENGAKSASLNYAPMHYPPFPKSVCISINNQVCHGIASPTRILKDGDILSIDVAVEKDGWYGDTCRMFYVGTPSILAKRLCDVTKESLFKAIDTVKDGSYINDIGVAIENHVRKNGYNVVREYGGHGLGENLHEPPHVFHYDRKDKTVRLRENMVITIEPMINAGSAETKTLNDQWTVVTKDRSLSAQWEHTLRVTNNGCEILT